MYVSANGLGARRGMGDLNCPGDPGCPGYVAPGSPDYQTSLLQEILANQQTGGTSQQTGAAAGTISQWLNANAGKVAIGAAGFLGLMIFLKAGR